MNRTVFSAMKKRLIATAMAFVMVMSLFYGTQIVADGGKSVDAAVITPQYRNVMYYGEWSIYAGQKNFTPEKIKGDLITHLNFAFLDVDKSGNLLSTDFWADCENPNVGYSVGSDNVFAGVAGAMVLLRAKYPNLKIGFSVGGWTRSGDFPALAGSESTRKAFARNLAKACHYYGYDFVDIDWEYPTADRDPDPEGNGVTVDKGCKGSEADKHNFTLMLQDIREALDEYGTLDGKHYELSVAMSASPTMMNKIEYDAVLDTVDFANMMTYDLNGAWAGYTAHQTALYTNDAYDPNTMPDAALSVDSCIKFLENKYGNSIDYSKVVVGIAPYTRGWAGVENDGRDPQNPGLYATAQPNSVKAADGTTSGTFAYSDINTLKNQYNLTEYYDEEAEAAYYYSPSTGYFFTCDNERSVAAKANYVKQKGLGGLISWMASLDSASAITQTAHDSLYGESATLEPNTIVYPKIQNINASVSVSEGKYVITVRNNNALTESSAGTILNPAGDKAFLPYAEKFAETANYPVFYIKTASGEILSGSSWEAGGTIGSKGGYTTVSVDSWPGKLGPGETITISLAAPDDAKASDIVEVSMAKRATANGAEYGWIPLIGNGAEPVTDEPTTAGQPTTAQQETTAQEVVTTGENQTTKTENITTTKAETITTNVQQATTAPSGDKYPVWAPGATYKAGDLVYYEGKIYENVIGHTAIVSWEPNGGGATLWRERSDLSGLPDTGDDETTPAGTEAQTTNAGGEIETTGNNYTVNGVLPQHLVTGYWHNFSNGSVDMKLGDVPTYYDVICVAFTGNTNVPGEATFTIDTDLVNHLNYSDAEFINDVKALKARGQHVLISVGGANGTININSQTAADTFAQSMIGIIERFGFEGIDIDLEGNAVSGTANMASALRTIRNHFGDDFIITMAPETAYMNPGTNNWTSAYWNLAMEIKDILTVVWPQFYNTGSMNGYQGSVVAPGGADFPANLCTLYIESGLRPDQLAIGVPSKQGAGGNYIAPAFVEKALNSLIYGQVADSFTPPRAYPTFRGLMTWSINWDATNNYEWGKAARRYVDAISANDPTQQPTQAPSQEPTTNVNNNPVNVTGLVATSNEANKAEVTWSDNSGKTQGYNVYLDGALVKSNLTVKNATLTGVTAGNHTVTVKSVIGTTESSGVSVNVNVKAPEVETTTNGEVPTTGEYHPTPGLSSRLLIGYYHMWSNPGNPFIKLRDVDPNWDVINISFATPVNVGSTDGRMYLDTSVFSSDYTVDDFKNDIRALQAQGKKIVLSIGGYEGVFSLVDDAGANQFASDINSIVAEYGFDGIDIDLEQHSVEFNGNSNDPSLINPVSPKIVYTTKAIRKIMNSHDDNFILSWAPETFYVQKGFEVYAGNDRWGGKDNRCGDYLPMINALRDVTSFVHVQLYNSGPIMGLDKQYYNMGTVEGIVAMEKMLLEGFYVGSANNASVIGEDTWFAPLRPDQIVIGVPCSASAAGSGQLSNANLQEAFRQLDAEYPGIRGIMTWSINWDSAQNGNSFARENQAFLQSMGKSEPQTEVPTQAPTEPVTEAPTEAPTQEPTTEAPTEAPKPTYTVTIDGDFVASVKEGNTYTLPSAQIAGYEYDGKMYKVGSTVTVSGDMDFESVEISSDYTLSYLMNANSGIQYKMEVEGPVTSDIKGAGAVLVTASVYKLFKNVTKALAPGRASDVTASEIAADGSFKVGLAGLTDESAYIEGRRARAYLDITYTGNGETLPTTVYAAISEENSLRAMATITRNSPSFRYMSNSNKEAIRVISGIN